MASLSHVTQLLALIGLLSGGVRAQMLYGNMMMPGAFMGGGMGLSPFFGGFDFDDFDDFDDDDDFDSARLTCVNNVTDSRTGQMSDAIAVTISYGLGGSGYGGSGYRGSGFNLGHDPYGLYGFNGGAGLGNNNNGPLKAEIQILSSGIGVASVVVTERARVEDGCHQETLGSIYTPRRRNNFQNNMYSGYGHMGFGGGMGMFDDDFGLSNGNGIIKGDIKINVNMQTIYLDTMDGFDSLSELAGRGIAICADSTFGWDWEASCEGPIYMCCALKYDNHDQKIHLYDYRGQHVTYA